MSAHQVPRLVITSGEPAGIGPDLCLMQASRPREAQLVTLGDPDLLKTRSRQLGLDVNIKMFSANMPRHPHKTGELLVSPVRTRESVVAGELNSNNAPYVLDTLSMAVQGCQSRLFDGMITAPVHKGMINDGGVDFSGHTEFLADLTNTPRVVMMLATEGLRVALVTTHLPLSQVSAAITPDLLEDIIQILHTDLCNHFGVDKPHILVCGLNPHAGEGGHMGREEIEVIEPVLEKLRSQGMSLHGPLPADTIFNPGKLEQADAVLAMYHDQGLPVLKYKGFGEAVNITLGLPIIRTSVDHGTALDLAGTGLAHAGSLNTAIDYALDMVRTKHAGSGKR